MSNPIITGRENRSQSIYTNVAGLAVCAYPCYCEDFKEGSLVKPGSGFHEYDCAAENYRESHSPSEGPWYGEDEGDYDGCGYDADDGDYDGLDSLL